MADLTPYQRDILIRTALGEARGEGVEGMADVIQTIFNRAESGRFPSDPAAVALQPGEYSTWNKGAGGNNPQRISANSEIYRQAGQALDAVLTGNRPDYTGGSWFYKTPAAVSSFHESQNQYGTITRHGHTYYPRHPVPPNSLPETAVATLLDVVPPRAPVPVTASPNINAMRNTPVSPRSTPSTAADLIRNTPMAAADPASVYRGIFPSNQPYLTDAGQITRSVQGAGQAQNTTLQQALLASLGQRPPITRPPAITPATQRQAADVRTIRNANQNAPLPAPPAAPSRVIATIPTGSRGSSVPEDYRYGLTTPSPRPPAVATAPRPATPSTVTTSIRNANGAQRPAAQQAANTEAARLAASRVAVASQAPMPMSQSDRLLASRAPAPAPQRVLLPPVPPSNLGQPPVTRTVQSVPVAPQGTTRVVATIPTGPRGSSVPDSYQYGQSTPSPRPPVVAAAPRPPAITPATQQRASDLALIRGANQNANAIPASPRVATVHQPAGSVNTRKPTDRLAPSARDPLVVETNLVADNVNPYNVPVAPPVQVATAPLPPAPRPRPQQRTMAVANIPATVGRPLPANARPAVPETAVATQLDVRPMPPMPIPRPGIGGPLGPAPVAQTAPAATRKAMARPPIMPALPPLPVRQPITVVVRGANVIQPRPMFLTELQRGVAEGGSAYDRNMSAGFLGKGI